MFKAIKNRFQMWNNELNDFICGICLVITLGGIGLILLML